MKLLFITSLKEYQKQAAHILNAAGVGVFSVSEIVGFRDHHHQPNLLDNWFSSGTEQFDSIFIFSFTDSEKADKAIGLIKDFNAKNDTGFPIRAFVIPVEKASYDLVTK